uniref:WASH complex subunit 7 n=1 Tax=Globodera rostochiensis TaxID=31243 RepID=A0A914I8K0_GLORO
MDAARQSRARAFVAAQFVTDVLAPLRAVDNGTAGHCSRNYCKIRSGCTLDSDFPSVHTSDAHSMVDACTSIFADLLNSADRCISLARSSLFDSLLLYGESGHHLPDCDEGASVIELISDFLPHLHTLDTFVRQCERLAACIFCQLNALLALSSSNGGLSAAQQQQQLISLTLVDGIRDLAMDRVWRCLGELLSVLIVFDEMIGHHPFLRTHWSQFVRSLRLAQHNPAQFALHGQSGRLQQLNEEIARLDAELMGGNIFGNICQRLARALFDSFPQQQRASSVPSAGERAFIDRFRRAIMDFLARWDRLSAAEDAIPDKQSLLALLALAQLFHALLAANNKNGDAKWKMIDRKMLRALYATHKRVVAFHLVGDILFTPAEHIAKTYGPIDADVIERKAKTSATQARAVLLEHQIAQMDREAQMLKLCVTEWCQKMDEFGCCPPTNGEPPEEIVDRKCNLLFDGARIVDKIGRLLKCILNGHLEKNRPLTKQNVRLLFKLVQQFKRISTTFCFQWAAVLEWTQFGCAKTASALLLLFDGQIGALVSTASGRGAKNAHAVAAFRNAQFSLAQTITKNGIVRCGVAVEMANYSKLLRLPDVQRVDDQLIRLDLLSNVGALLHRVTDLSFLYWHRQFLCETFCGYLISDTAAGECDLHFFEALSDSTHQLLQNAVHSDHQALLHSFGIEMFAIFKEKFLDKLCTKIENDLRFSYHSQQSASLGLMGQLLFGGTSDGIGGLFLGHPDDPTSKSACSPSATAAQHLFRLLHLPPFQMGDKLINVKAFVTCHLESTFYNLSVLALHDCDSYRRMALLAHQRYQVRLFDTGLPNMSVDQGLDLLMVMTDVDTFVANYCYDLNEQFFIERSGHGKSQLSILRAQQVVNSVKTHGLGILNTLVNSAYKFLRVQLQRLSLCLFDERIKTLLMQEIRFYRDAMDELDQLYPMSRAERLANALRRYDGASLGTDGGADCLNKLRVLITRMGNMLGLLRLIRTGIVEFCSPVIFHESLDTVGAEKGHKTTDQQHNPTAAHVAEDARRLRDRALQNALCSLTDSRDCVELLTSVFAREFRCNGSKNYGHLRHFFVAVPALTLCHVEHTTGCRARLQTSARRETAMTTEHPEERQQQTVFVEDGFSMGVAYVLTLLNQRFFFDFLNWCDSVQNRFFRAELAKNSAELREAQKRKDESLARVLAVKTTQLDERRAEHRLLACTLNSALTLFQANEMLGEEQGEETFLEDL